MNNSYSSITHYTINDVRTHAGEQKTSGGFHVIKSEEIHCDETMLHPSRSDHFSIFIVTEGQGRIQSNHANYLLLKNSLFIIPPGIVHHFQGKNEAYKGVLLQFTKDFLLKAELHKKHLDAFTFFSRQNNPLLPLSEIEAKNLIELMLILGEKDLTPETLPFRQEIIHHSFNLFLFELASLFRKHRENDITKITRKEEILMRFVQLLALHFKEERSVQYYADQLYVSPKHLSKTVKEVVGKTSGTMIDEMVITEAKILLDDPLMSVGKVADELHFSDQFFFSKFFKNNTGLNPSEYKRNLEQWQN